MSQPLYRIGTLAKLSGLSTHAIRVWERRYGAAAPSRSPGGARLYTDEDVQRFRLIQELLQRGYATRAIAKLDMAELQALATPSVAVPPTPTAMDVRADETVTALLDAVAELDVETAERILTRAGNDFSPRELLIRVLAPALTEIGLRWQRGALCTAGEHAISALLRTRLGAMLAAQPVTDEAPILCTTPAGERHELGALLVAVLIAMHGRRALYLGADLPASEIGDAARRSRAVAVALSIAVLPAAEAGRQLALIDQALPLEVEVVLGGRGAARLGHLPERFQVLASLSALELWLDGFSAAGRASA